MTEKQLDLLLVISRIVLQQACKDRWSIRYRLAKAIEVVEQELLDRLKSEKGA